MISMKEMQRRKMLRKAGTPAETRHPKIISPWQQRGKSKAWRDDAAVEPALVVRKEDIAKLDAMQRNRPLKPPPTRFVAPTNSAAAVAARHERNGVA